MPEVLIGPNAIIQVVEAMRCALGDGVARSVLEAANLARYLVASPPAHMVPEAEVASLHRAVAGAIQQPQACEIMRTAGHNTARYLLANRIPAPAQLILKALPAPLAARALLKAIDRHAWTFAGSSTFTWQPAHPVHIRLAGSPLFETPACHSLAASYFQATFETLFRSLVNPHTRAIAAAPPAHEKDADGNIAACAFELVWRA